MRRYVLVFAFSLFAMIESGHALAVFDASNLAQNVVAAREAITHTQQQIQGLTNQLNQYKRMLQDAANPGSWAWGDIQDTLNQLKNTLGSVKNMSSLTGGFDEMLSQFGSYDMYSTGSGYGSSQSPEVYSGEYLGSKMRKESADDLFRIIKDQEEQLDAYQTQFERLKDSSSSAEGQQEAIQAGNQFLSMQLQMLGQIHVLLMAQNNMLGAVVEDKTNLDARNRMGTALQTGESSLFVNEREGTGKSFGFTKK